MIISGKTRLIAHLGYPTESFKAPMIYNPWFVKQGIDAMVIPIGVKAEDYLEAFKSIRKFTNLHGALITMPHVKKTLMKANGTLRNGLIVPKNATNFRFCQANQEPQQACFAYAIFTANMQALSRRNT